MRGRHRQAGERGSAFLMCLTLVMIMTLLGVALFEMTSIEARLAQGDLSDMQAFYCAEAEAARVYALYKPGKQDEVNERWQPGRREVIPETEPLALGGGRYTVSGSAVVDVATNRVVKVTVTCELPNGRRRMVERDGTRAFASEIYRFGLAAGGASGGAQGAVVDLVLGGQPPQVPGGSVGGADTITGADIFVAGNVHIAGQAAVTGYGTASPPTITVATGNTVTSTSPGFNPAAPGATGQGAAPPLPVLSNAAGTGVIDAIGKAVAGKMRLVQQNGPTIYNLSEIFAQLGSTSEGNRERNLARPSKCTFGVPSSDLKCQVWQELLILGPRQTPSPDPGDKASYAFMGLPRSPSAAPQGTAFSTIFAAAVAGSPELQQLEFTPQYSSLGAQLDAILGPSPSGEGRIERLVDLTVGIDPATGKAVKRDPAIFYVDGHWRTDGSTSGFAYNGRATIAATKSVVVSDSLLYLGGLDNVNKDVPKSCSGGAGDRVGCGAADMLGILAQEDIWIGDPNGRVFRVDAVMLAGRDVNLVQPATPETCCRGTSNPLTFNGAVLALRGTALARDWANPTPGSEASACTVAQPPCRPVTFVKGDSSCGKPGEVSGCWRYLSKDPAAGLFAVESSAGFRECVLSDTERTCAPGTRRVTHFQLNIAYDKRLQEHAELIPPGLPTGGDTMYSELVPSQWKDCGNRESC